MNYSASCRHTIPSLKIAQEIYVKYPDIKRLDDLMQPYRFKKYVIYIDHDDEPDWAQLSTYHEVLPDMTIACADTSLFEECRKNNFRYFWMFPASSYWELRRLLGQGVSEVKLDAPLYFDLEKVYMICTEHDHVTDIRLTANICYNSHLGYTSGIRGTYIRPEDVKYYSKYVSTLELAADTLSKELELIKIYQRGSWPGNLNLLLTNLNYNVDNRVFPEKFAQKRANCGQKCMEDSFRCNYCAHQFELISFLDKNKTELKKIY